MHCVRSQSSQRSVNELPSEGMKSMLLDDVKVSLFLVVSFLKQRRVMLGGCYQQTLFSFQALFESAR